MATYAIGDIQGCYRTFRRLLQRIDFDPARDRLWLTGDLVNRGPDSVEVLRWARDHRQSVVAVLGNHDLHLLALARGQGRRRRRDTLRSVLDAPDREELIQWLLDQPLIHVDDPFVMVHAGVLPSWSMDDVLDLGAELREVLEDSRGDQLLAAHEAKEMPRWSDELEGHERWIAAMQVFANLRFCDGDGQPRFGVKVAPHEAPSHLTPWFDVPHRRPGSSVVICGHWASLGLHVRDDVIALDTGCVWGGFLSAIRLEDRQVFQEPSTDPAPRHRPF